VRFASRPQLVLRKSGFMAVRYRGRVESRMLRLKLIEDRVTIVVETR
jgi:hypothetical protein